MYGYFDSTLQAQLVRDRQDRLRRQAGRSHLYRESKRTRTHQRAR